LITRGVWRNPFDNREMMIDGIPNRPLYFYQKDIIGPIPSEGTRYIRRGSATSAADGCGETAFFEAAQTLGCLMENIQGGAL